MRGWPLHPTVAMGKNPKLKGKGKGQARAGKGREFQLRVSGSVLSSLTPFPCWIRLHANGVLCAQVGLSGPACEIQSIRFTLRSYCLCEKAQCSWSEEMQSHMQLVEKKMPQGICVPWNLIWDQQTQDRRPYIQQSRRNLWVNLFGKKCQTWKKVSVCCLWNAKWCDGFTHILLERSTSWSLHPFAANN